MNKTEENSGVGVLDKAVAILSQLEAGPVSLSRLVATTHLARPTVYQLAVALEHRRFVNRDAWGRFILRPRFAELAGATDDDQLLTIATPVLAALRDHTHESYQLFRCQADQQICVVAVDRPIRLRDSVSVGALLSLRVGSSTQVLLAWGKPERIYRTMRGTAFNVTQLSEIRRRGWMQAVGEREVGVTSVAVPVRRANGRVVAAVYVSGPVERLRRQPRHSLGPAMVATAQRPSEFLRHESDQSPFHNGILRPGIASIKSRV